MIEDCSGSDRLEGGAILDSGWGILGALGLLLHCCLPVAAQDFAEFLPPSGPRIRLPIEPNRAYQARWSSDLVDWSPLGDLYFPISGHVRSLPKEDSFFVRLEPGLSMIDWEPLVVIIGDSTVADLSPVTPSHHGWGQVLQDFFPPEVRVVNLAEGGLGTRRFFRDGRINHVNRLQPDIVVIQFGHIDYREGLTLDEYEENIATLVGSVRRINAIPILVTPVARRLFDDKGLFLHQLAPWRERVIRVAEKERAALADLNGRSADLYRRLGPEQSPILTVCGDACSDQAHFSKLGAYVMASLATREFPPILRHFVVPLGQLDDKISKAFRHIEQFSGHEIPFAERSGGFRESQLWDWVYPSDETDVP